MATAQEIINIASAEVGYKEGASNANKYGRDYGVDNVEWCVQFVWWVFKTAGASELFGAKTARCTVLYQNHRDQEVAELAPGDIVFFDWSGSRSECDHVGIVYSVGSDSIVTIEGNTGGDGGEGVHKKTRARKWISHNFRPKYDGPEALLSVNLPLLKMGSTGGAVKTVQRLLVALGYKLPRYGIDGDYGAETAGAVVRFQFDRRLVGDGIVGANTWTALLNG